MLGSAPDLGASGISGQIRCPIFTCFKVQAASSEYHQLASGEFPSEKLPTPCFGRYNHRQQPPWSEGSCREEPVAVDVLAAVDECSEKLGGGLGRQNLEEKLVVKARRVPERLGHDNHQDFVALP